MKLTVNFECLDGYYKIDINNNTYSIETNINYLNSTSGVLDNDNYNSYKEMFNKTNICLWQPKYETNGLSIEDSVKWNVTYIDDNDTTYSSSGEEGFWPYEFDTLIHALMYFDSNIKCFISNNN